MFKKILKVIGAILLAVTPIFVTYHLNRSQPDVRYTLSEGIPVSFLGTGSGTYESIQQLEVRNIGNARAERVVVKIEGQMTSYEIVKHVASDVVEIFDQQQPIEIIYPGLPPQAGFKLIFKSPVGIEYSDLSITHSAGAAKEALSQTSVDTTVIILLGIYAVLFGGWAFLSAKDSIKSSFDLWKTKAASNNLEKVLNLPRPWYVAEAKWKTAHADVFRRKVKDDYLYTREIADSTAYRILCAEKPDHIDSSDWNEVVALAVDRLEKGCSELARGYMESHVMRLLRLEKPKYFPQDKWDDLSERANQNFVALRKQTFLKLDSLLQALREEKPAELCERSWFEIITNLQGQYYEVLMGELQTSDAPLDVLSKHDVSVLDEKRRHELEQWVFTRARYEKLIGLFDSLVDEHSLGTDKPALVSDWEWFRLKRFEEKVAELASDTEKTRALMQLLDGLLLDRKIIGTDKPDLLTDREWEKLKKFEEQMEIVSDVECRAKEIQVESSRIAAEKDEVCFLKERVERQLNIIHDLLSDPSRIDRIESYDDTFAPGNLENLRRVAKVLDEIDQT